MLHETIFNATLCATPTMLLGFELLSNTCNIFPQRNVALKIVLCAKLHDIEMGSNLWLLTSLFRFYFIEIRIYVEKE